MRHLLQRHPFPVVAHFDSTLVLAYALPARVLEPMLRPGLRLDQFGDLGFIAVALVQTRALRPAFLPAFLGQSFFLSGYRIFVNYQTREGKTRRGLQILRSDTDKPLMQIAGNLLTHYNYHRASVQLERLHKEDGTHELAFHIQTPRAQADLDVRAFLSHNKLPPQTPFPDLETARRFAGPLPFTFDYEAATHSMIAIKGVRKKWNPLPVRVEVERATFFEQFADKPVLANAFWIEDIPYRWEKGVRETLPTACASD